MSADVQRAIENAREELVRRLNDEEELRKIPPLTLVKMATFLEGSLPSVLLTHPGQLDHVAFVRALGLPADRRTGLLAQLLGVTPDEAASLLASDAGQVADQD